MSQPFDRGCKVPAPGSIDDDLGEFWESSPWEIPAQHNLSGYERNRTYLNVQGTNFLDISHVTGTDSDGDGRCSVVADINGDGMQELIVRQVGGGALFLFENRFPQQNWLRVTLRGVESNRLGIGSKVSLEADGQMQTREISVLKSYRSQAPAQAHFGLAKLDAIDQVTIRWPSGQTQEVTSIPANQHIVITEGQDGFEVVEPGKTITP